MPPDPVDEIALSAVALAECENAERFQLTGGLCSKTSGGENDGRVSRVCMVLADVAMRSLFQVNVVNDTLIR